METYLYEILLIITLINSKFYIFALLAGYLLQGLRDGDTIVRWSAAKG